MHMNLIRSLLAEWLLMVVLRIVPEPDRVILSACLNAYAREMLRRMPEEGRIIHP